MNLFVVENKRQLIAAIRAGVRREKWSSEADGFEVRLLGLPTVYKFPLGLSEARARQICRNIRRTPAAVFRSEE